MFQFLLEFSSFRTFVADLPMTYTANEISVETFHTAVRSTLLKRLTLPKLYQTWAGNRFHGIRGQWALQELRGGFSAFELRFLAPYLANIRVLSIVIPPDITSFRISALSKLTQLKELWVELTDGNVIPGF